MSVEKEDIKKMQSVGVEEVEACFRSEKGYDSEGVFSELPFVDSKKLADVATTAIQQRDEVTGLLVWLAKSKIDGLSVMAVLTAAANYGDTNATRILEIVAASKEVGT